MAKAEDAVALFQQGFTCSQALLSVFAQDFGLDRDMALRISQGFGAGIAYTDDTCGAVSGAIMVIGLRYGRIRADDIVAKEKTYAVVREFLREFKKRNGSVDCTGLLGYDLSDPQQVAEVKKNKVVMARCPAFVRDAVKLVEILV
ncbi:MAG: C-GCAxxG-C-C family protein [Halobacteriota archaeon]|jgi:C_GCAxxG_C_C family probable redox protein